MVSQICVAQMANIKRIQKDMCCKQRTCWLRLVVFPFSHYPLSPSITSSLPSFHPLPLGSMEDPQKRRQENSSESSEGTESGLSTTQV